MKYLEEPLTRPLVSVTKKYLSAFSEELEGLELERYHFVLLRIDENDELTQKALANLLHVDKSFMVNIIDYLAERGYVTREKNVKDRREQIIRLTDKARQDIPVIRTAIKRLNKKSLKNVSEEQLETYREVLNMIQANLSDSRPNIFVEYKKFEVK
ncbi:MAG: MarR family transcriptional regulator [Sphingobacteriaceae bacterium]|jgi:DNA-binding MarR family transcriptional regulator|nr:MarR family transcriptional regulator [Sphingobacteriaceae bacterium]